MKIIRKDIMGAWTVVAQNIVNKQHGQAMLLGLKMFSDDKDCGVSFIIAHDSWQPDEDGMVADCCVDGVIISTDCPFL